MNRIGEFAALGTAVAFGLSSIFHTLAGRQVGSVIVNRMRLLFAISYLLAMHLIGGIPLPFSAGSERFFWLGLSGIVGLAIGDAMLFQAFIYIGARLAMLLMSLAPVLAAVIAWIFLKESLSLVQVAGMLLAISGVALVVRERSGNAPGTAAARKNYSRGILLGLGACACQAIGYILAKPGLANNFSPISGALLRMTAATIIIWGMAFFQRQVGLTFRSVNRRAVLLLAAGALVGPVIGVTLSMLAIQTTEIGIASTLIALTPVFLLPIGFFFFHERFGWKAIAGTLLAMSGVAILFLL